MIKETSKGEYQAPGLHVICLQVEAGLCQSTDSASINFPSSSSGISSESFEMDDEFNW